MKTIVLDLEFCQPSGLIIEVGAVCVQTKTGEIISRFSEMANPGELPDEFITNLTGITADMVANAKPLFEVLIAFWAWCQACQCGMQMSSWGGDVYEIAEASKALGVPYPRFKFMNIKEVAKVFRAGLSANQVKKTGGLRNTMDVFGLAFEGTQHRALPDAENTARLLHYFVSVVNRESRVRTLYQE